MKIKQKRNSWHLTKQGQFQYSTTLDGKREVRAVEDGNEVIVCKKKNNSSWCLATYFKKNKTTFFASMH